MVRIGKYIEGLFLWSWRHDSFDNPEQVLGLSEKMVMDGNVLVYKGTESDLVKEIKLVKG